MAIKCKSATLEDVKFRIVQHREGGEVTDVDTYYDITFRVPADAVDSNQFKEFARAETIHLDAELSQLVLDLENKPARAPVSTDEQEKAKAA